MKAIQIYKESISNRSLQKLLAGKTTTLKGIGAVRWIRDIIVNRDKFPLQEGFIRLERV